MDKHPPLRLPGGRQVAPELLAIRATTSGGPGGQHANRTATRVEVRVSLDALELTDAELGRLVSRLGRRVRMDRTIAASCGENRSQLQNRNEATRRLERLIGDALRLDAPRRASRPSRAAKERRLDAKSHRSQLKRQRRQPPTDT